MKKRVLIIEGSVDHIQMLRELAEDLDLEVAVIPHLIHVKDIKKFAPSLIMLDHGVEQGLGIALCNRIRKTSGLEATPIIILVRPEECASVSAPVCADSLVVIPLDGDVLQDEIRRLIKLN